jgi:hypothetical protein
MSREPDAGMQPGPGPDVQAPHARDAEDAVNGIGTRLPDGSSRCYGSGPASEPFTSVLALPSRPGTRATMVVTACADGHGDVIGTDEHANRSVLAPTRKRDADQWRALAALERTRLRRPMPLTLQPGAALPLAPESGVYGERARCRPDRAGRSSE